LITRSNPAKDDLKLNKGNTMSIKKFAVATFIAINIATVSVAQAGVVFNGGAPDQLNGYFADTNNSYTAAATIATLSSNVTFNGINWWGGFYPNAGTTGNDAFTLQILSNNSLNPGSVLDTVVLGSGNGTLTGATLLGNPEYSYQASFAPITLTAGSYFISLSNSYNATSDSWIWETTSNGPQLNGALFNGTNWYYQAGESLAYNLTGTPSSVPEPASIALLGIGLLAMSLGRRRNSML
jgi:hypothetical protein